MIACTLAVSTSMSIAGAVDAGPSGGALPPQLALAIDVVDGAGVPADAQMVALSVTAVSPQAAGHLTVYACDATELPEASNLNYLAGTTVPNLALSRIAPDGTVCIATHAVTDVVVDVVGYVPNGSTIVGLLAPIRVRDTRDDGAPVAARSILDIDLDGDQTLNVQGVPVRTVLLNLTAVRAEAPGHATLYACGTDVPATSTINYVPGRTTANFAVTAISDDGRICVYSHATAHFVVDVVAVATSGIVTLPQPVRIRDTRDEGQKVAAGATMVLDVAGEHGVPLDATSAVYNLTAVGADARGHATSYPCTTGPPNASNLNYVPGSAAAVGTITKLSVFGQFCVRTHASSHFVVDLVGYTTGANSYLPLEPIRVMDTRRVDAHPCNRLFRAGREVFDLATNRWTALENWGVLDAPSLDCQTAFTLDTLEGKVREVNVSGTTIATFTPLPTEIVTLPSKLLREGEHGELFAARGDRVYDVRTGAVAYEFPSPFELDPPVTGAAIVQYLDVTPDLSFALVSVHESDASGNTSGRTLVVDLDTLENWAVDRSAKLSPNGDYVATVEETSTGSVVRVATRFGEDVASHAFSGAATVRWIGVGDLAVCTFSSTGFTTSPEVTWTRTMSRWRIFDEPQLLSTEQRTTVTHFGGECADLI